MSDKVKYSHEESQTFTRLTSYREMYLLLKGFDESLPLDALLAQRNQKIRNPCRMEPNYFHISPPYGSMFSFASKLSYFLFHEFQITINLQVN